MRHPRSLGPLGAFVTLMSAFTLGTYSPVLAAEPVAAAITERSVGKDSGPALARRSDAVVVISVDGLRPDAIDRFGAKTLQRLMREGSYSLEAQTILPSKTLPSHTSMLTGVEPTEHGITWNEDQVETRGRVAVPTAFGMAREAGLRTAAFFSKPKFHHLEVPGTLDFSASPGEGETWSSDETVEQLESYLASGERSDLTFVHVPDTDYTGHVWSWMSWMYGRAVRSADDAVATVLATADQAYGKGNYTVIVTADHGGSGWNHGSDDPRDQTIPWIAWGKGVRAGMPLAPGIRTIDTAATALWLLGVQPPETVDGRPVRAAFEVGAWLATQGRSVT